VLAQALPAWLAGWHAALAMSEQKKLRRKLGREPTADELKTASKLRKAKKQAAADALATPTVPAATTSARKKRAAPGPTGGSAAKTPRVAEKGKKAKKGKEAKKAKGLEGLGDLFGLSRLKGVVQDGLYVELLEVAMVANQTLAKQTARADRLRAKLAEETGRADRLRADLRDSIKERLVLRGIVDLRSILDDVLPASKEVEPLVNWLQGEQDRRRVKSAAQAAGGHEASEVRPRQQAAMNKHPSRARSPPLG
jgi:hypothetical protein